MIPDIEKATEKEIQLLQEQRLRELIYYTTQNSAYYKRIFRENNLQASDINTLADLTKIPTTSKEDLQRYNDDFLCVDRNKIIDYVTTSGTLGEPVTFALTDNDLNRLAYNEAISFDCAGVTADDILQLTTTIDRRFMAGLAYFLGARELGAGIIRVGAGIPELQWDSIIKFKPTYLIVVPSFLLKLIEYAHQHGIDPNKAGVKGAICIGESLRNDDFSLNTLAAKIKKDWNITLYSTYASTEMSTAFTECKAQQGGHHHPELIIIEILDDEEKPVPVGMPGELTITTLGVEGMPLLRFKTGDIVKAHTSKCSCERNTQRLGPVIGRKKQMIKYKGTTLYPPAMYNVLNYFNEIEAFVIEIDHNAIGTDEICIKIAALNPTDTLLQTIKDHFRAKLRVLPKIEFHDFKTLQELRFPKMSRKPVIVIDHRL
ncbi:phenylacetate--CoA ligase family protein [Arenibacter sp. TNZ]|jgi:phenylacetate-CoA ligase|uniref:phenylacetate--CoA ligase family protein n=1 Tax=Arenibacter TaxID=178469 RepID=UPI000CD45D26|nr:MULTISPECIES: AMP-binding protein [Arenibacter]MCM4170029.1 phenylacetate--CoA ligase family protein [Arenibacter sp. TNZ]